jgi:hypothetical protein
MRFQDDVRPHPAGQEGDAPRWPFAGLAEA